MPAIAARFRVFLFVLPIGQNNMSYLFSFLCGDTTKN